MLNCYVLVKCNGIVRMSQNWFPSRQDKEEDKPLLSAEEELKVMVVIDSQKASSSDCTALENLFSTSVDGGISSKEAVHRQKLYGYNDFDVGEDIPLWKKYLLMVIGIFN